MQNKSYKLVTFGRGNAASALCKICAQGELGESLLREGFTKRRFCELIAKLVLDRQAKGKPLDVIIDALELVDCSNMSAAKQALEACTIQFEELDENGESVLRNDKGEIDPKGQPAWSKAQSISGYWEKQGGPKAKVNLSALD